jgi:hypothetical protein
MFNEATAWRQRPKPRAKLDRPRAQSPRPSDPHRQAVATLAEKLLAKRSFCEGVGVNLLGCLLFALYFRFQAAIRALLAIADIALYVLNVAKIHIVAIIIFRIEPLISLISSFSAVVCIFA